LKWNWEDHQLGGKTSLMRCTENELRHATFIPITKCR
jgi:hypothetical protein